MNHTIGTCSNCGGRVVLSAHWMSVKPEIPHCESCGARVAQPHGHVIEMEPPKKSASPFPDREFAELLQEKFKGTCWEPLVRSTGWGHPGDFGTLFPRDVR